MPDTILITGGAGFIGSHLADELLRRGHRVRALDNLSPQVHGPDGKRPSYLARDVDLVVGDVRDPDAVRRALSGVDGVFHFAAAVGVGQSMYRIAEYTSVNNLGTAVLLEALSQKPVKRLVVASSMSLYGEGLYRTAGGQIVDAEARPIAQLKRRAWEPAGPAGEALFPFPTPEEKTPSLQSVYALSKYDQERLCLMTGRAYGIPTIALRFFNVYGPRQALGNPYTGVLAIFASRLLCGKPPLVFEDGHQRRDFVSVHDIVRAALLAYEKNGVDGAVLNVGSGRDRTVREVAASMAQALGRRIEPEITQQYRVGDIRHCFADITRAERRLGYRPEVTWGDGLAELARWLEGQEGVDRAPVAKAELEARGLAL
jgi:dTDP-L-rhamnose 4-epimerase